MTTYFDGQSKGDSIVEIERARKLRLNSGGYTDRGEYFGVTDQAVYQIDLFDRFGRFRSEFLRASSRTDAFQKVRERWRNCFVLPEAREPKTKGAK